MTTAEISLLIIGAFIVLVLRFVAKPVPKDNPDIL
jgi:hypothetical protein